MKQFPKIILLVLLTMVIVLGTFSIGQAAYLNQIQGCLIKSATSPDPVNNNWEWGAIVTLFDISGGTKTQLEQVSLDGSLFQYCFTFSSFTPITTGARTLLVEVNYNASPGSVAIGTIGPISGAHSDLQGEERRALLNRRRFRVKKT